MMGPPKTETVVTETGGWERGPGGGWRRRQVVERGVVRQRGGPLNLGGWTLVGDPGPNSELISPWGWVYDARTTRKLLESGIKPNRKLALAGGIALEDPYAAGKTFIKTKPLPKVQPGGGQQPKLWQGLGTTGTAAESAAVSAAAQGAQAAMEQAAVEQAVQTAVAQAIKAVVEPAQQAAVAQARAAREQTEILKDVRERLYELPSTDDQRALLYETRNTSGI